MKKIFCNQNEMLLCSMIQKKDILEQRTSLSLEHDLLQVAVKKLNCGNNVAAHKHKLKERTTLGTQETWIVLQGKIKANIFNTEDTFIESITLIEGDIIIFFAGGHELITL
jgi:hypothetical protein